MANEIDYKKAPEELDFEFIYTRLYEYWKNIALSIFKWKGLENVSDNLTSEIIEEQLFDSGKDAFWKHKTNGFLCLPATNGYDINVYGKPQSYSVFSKNGMITATVKVDDCVIIKNNNLGMPTAKMLQYYCTKLAEIEMTKQLNLDAHKMPYVFETDSDTELTNKNIFKQIRTCKPVIFKKKGPSDASTPINVLNTGAQYILDKLEDDYNCYVAKILTLLGLDNFVEDKAERVQSAEVEANQEYIIMSFKTMLDNRKEACEKINKKFGLSLSVEYVFGEQIEPEDKPKEESEGEENE